MGSRRCCGGVLEKTFLQTVVVALVVVMAEHGGIVSSLKVCPATDTSFMRLEDSELFLVPASQHSVTFNVSLERCNINEHFELDLPYIDENYKAVFVKDFLGDKWFQLRFKLNSAGVLPELYVMVEALRTYRLYAGKYIMGSCSLPVYNVTSDAITKLSKKCKGSGRLALDFEQPDGLYEDILGNGVVDDFDGDETNRKLHKLWKDLEDSDNNYNDFVNNNQNFNDFANNNQNFNTQVYRPSYRGGHIVFIPVGAIIFLLSVCLRCCLCRRKKMIQRVRTITVVRRVSVPNSSGAEVNEPTSPDPMDLPPSYAEIEVEAPPPAYSELENSASLVRHEEQQSADEEPSTEFPSAADTATSTADGDLGEVGTRSTLTRVLTSGSRSLKSQFAFQPMKEED